MEDDYDIKEFIEYKSNKFYRELKTNNLDDIFHDEIVEIEELDCGELIDIEVNKDHLFYANDILTKNSMGIASTCDFMGILGSDEDKLLYESEIHYKIAKNRLGGRVGEINKLFMDKRSLKLYDENEFEIWLDDAKRSNDSRDLAARQ